MNKNLKFPEWQKQRLLLIKLTNLIQQGSKIDIAILEATFEKMKIFLSVLPTKDYDTFSTFPYKDSAGSTTLNISNDKCMWYF